jgi:MFS family permease
MIKTPYLNWYGRGFRLRAAITISCQLAFVLFGYDQGVFSGIVGNADFLDTFNHPSPALEGIIVSIYNLGCFTGCILTFVFAEKTGRKLAMWIAMVWIIVCAHPSHPKAQPLTEISRWAQSSKPPPSPFHISWSRGFSLA